MAETDSGRVAKNAVALALRMVLVAVVGLYTSRVVLEVLGVDDYGLYGLVGGIVGLASFLNMAMASASSRFITYELGRGEINKVKNVFSTALVIHLWLAGIVIVLAETVGLWFLNYKLVIPLDRMFAANVLYQLSVLSIVVGFTQVPYEADIIAHEKMKIYAYFEIINVILKLVIVYCLLITSKDRLILYGVLVSFSSIMIALFYRWYCIRHFPEARFSLHRDKEITKQMLSFSVFDLYGNMSVVVKNQGQPIVLNLFFGVVANAGASIALTVVGILQGFTSSVSVAFRPQIIKQYAAGEVMRMADTMRKSNIFTIMIFSIVSLPFLIETPRILYLWLGQIPPYSVDFLRIIVLTAMAKIVVNTTNIASHASGDIRRISFINGSFFLLCPFIAYVVLKFMVLDSNVVYLVDLGVMLSVIFVGAAIVKAQIKGFPIKRYTKDFFSGFIVSGIGFAGIWALKKYCLRTMDIIPYTSIFYSLLLLTVMTIVGAVVIGGLNLAFVFTPGEREYMKERIVKFTSKFRK